MAVGKFSKNRVFGDRRSDVVPATSGDYVDLLVIGRPGSGERSQSIDELGVLIEAIPAGATPEVWLPRWSDSALSADQMTSANCTNGGFTTLSAGTTGFFKVNLAGAPWALLRVKSGGTTGTATASVWAL